MKQYRCGHCGHQFEAGEKDDLVCPRCFWSTSVEKNEVPAGSFESKERPKKSSLLIPWRKLGGVFGVSLLVVGIGWVVSRQFKEQQKILSQIDTQNKEVIAKNAPEFSLTPEQKGVLERKVALEKKSGPSPAEQEALSFRVPFPNLGVKGLPTPPWDEKEHEEFLKVQQIKYLVTLEWTYRRKLKKLFKEHYLAAAAAFEARNYLLARDEWVRSLAFPVYAGDVKKHRGVVLTMLRPFINDVLSKTGAMNLLLIEKEGVSREEKIKSSYQRLHELLAQQAWEEAAAAILELNQQIDPLPAVPEKTASPPLPAEAALVDEGIRSVLLAQVAPSQPSQFDWEALRQDIAGKEKVVERQLPEFWQTLTQRHEEALALIRNRDWKSARQILQKMDYPDELAEDAAEKISVLDRLMEGGDLDSVQESG